ncbi:hypothetical protein F5Y01DRAFT_89104 [Xylaria sp. FL0043]|nr:hypothetical protein F5Y01DRAFT_89104 [Xylaria sp. FL0043]
MHHFHSARVLCVYALSLSGAGCAALNHANCGGISRLSLLTRTLNIHRHAHRMPRWTASTSTVLHSARCFGVSTGS